MANANCLEGMKCQVCGNADRFYIFAVVECEVTDNGVEDTGSADWNDESKCQCPDCKTDGPVRDFKEKKERVPCVPSWVGDPRGLKLDE